MKLNKKVKLIIGIVIFFIFVDQISKFIVNISVKEEVNIIPNFFSITKIENEGIAFGLNKRNISNILLISIILLLLVNYMIKQKENISNLNYLFLSMILAGGFSNLIDRIFKGAVLDFLKIADFPIFNFADICIVIGWMLFVISFMRVSYKEIKFEKNKHDKGV